MILNNQLKTYYTFDDVSLKPQYSTIRSRKDVSLVTRLTKDYFIPNPIVGSPMDTICEDDMACALYEIGSCGVLHRFMSLEKQAQMMQAISEKISGSVKIESVLAAAIGVKGDYLERAQELAKIAFCKVLILDVAHGDHVLVEDALRNLKRDLPSYMNIIAGNIATQGAARRLIDAGADGLRVNVGSGGLCTTRVETGHGVPCISSLMEIAEVAHKEDIPLMSDGGIRNAGDAVKALAAGAETVMLGSLLAGTDETPCPSFDKDGQRYKSYRGSASFESKSARGESGHVEGVSTFVPARGPVKDVVQKLLDGIRSGYSYSGAFNVWNLHHRSEFIHVTQSGITEAQPHTKLYYNNI